MAATTNSITYSTEIVHIGSGASLAAAGISGSADVSVALSGTGNLARYPLADVVLKIAPTASIALASQTIYLYRRDINVDSTNDEKVPDASNKKHMVASFIVPASTTASTTHYIKESDVPLGGGDCEFYIENGLAVNIPVGWTLKITPKTSAFA